jgi:hypothetical protein
MLALEWLIFNPSTVNFLPLVKIFTGTAAEPNSTLVLSALFSVPAVFSHVRPSLVCPMLYSRASEEQNSSKEQVSHVNREKEFDQHPEDHQEGQCGQGRIRAGIGYRRHEDSWTKALGRQGPRQAPVRR